MENKGKRFERVVGCGLEDGKNSDDLESKSRTVFAHILRNPTEGKGSSYHTLSSFKAGTTQVVNLTVSEYARHSPRAFPLTELRQKAVYNIYFDTLTLSQREGWVATRRELDHL